MEFNIEKIFHLKLTEDEILSLLCGLNYLIENKNTIIQLPNGVGFEEIEKIYNLFDLTEYHME